MSAEVTEGVKTQDDGGETPDLCTGSLFLYYLRRCERGSEAWAAALEAKAEQSRRVELFRAELCRIIGEREDIVFRLSGGCIEAEVEGLRFATLERHAPRWRGDSARVALVGRCPACGVETVSEPFDGLAGLGEMLASFAPAREHFRSLRHRVRSHE
jgi:uracil-DNA glycosylase